MNGQQDSEELENDGRELLACLWLFALNFDTFFAYLFTYLLGFARGFLLFFLGVRAQRRLDGTRGGYSDILLHRTPDIGQGRAWFIGEGERGRALLAGLIDLQMQTGIGAVLYGLEHELPLQ
jgi:hypothetical protein